MRQIEIYIGTAKRLGSNCVSHDQAIREGLAFGAKVAVETLKFEDEMKRHHGAHRGKLEAAFARAIEEADADSLARTFIESAYANLLIMLGDQKS